jgi:hypothetical protein
LIPKAPVEETVKETGRITELGSGSTRDLTGGGAWSHEGSDAASLSDGTNVVGNGDALASGIELAGAQGESTVGPLDPQVKMFINIEALMRVARVDAHFLQKLIDGLAEAGRIHLDAVRRFGNVTSVREAARCITGILLNSEDADSRRTILDGGDGGEARRRRIPCARAGAAVLEGGGLDSGDQHTDAGGNRT